MGNSRKDIDLLYSRGVHFPVDIAKAREPANGRNFLRMVYYIHGYGSTLKLLFGTALCYWYGVDEVLRRAMVTVSVRWINDEQCDPTFNKMETPIAWLRRIEIDRLRWNRASKWIASFKNSFSLKYPDYLRCRLWALDADFHVIYLILYNYLVATSNVLHEAIMVGLELF